MIVDVLLCTSNKWLKLKKNALESDEEEENEEESEEEKVLALVACR